MAVRNLTEIARSMEQRALLLYVALHVHSKYIFKIVARQDHNMATTRMINDVLQRTFKFATMLACTL